MEVSSNGIIGHPIALDSPPIPTGMNGSSLSVPYTPLPPMSPQPLISPTKGEAVVEEIGDSGELPVVMNGTQTSMGFEDGEMEK